MDALLKARKKVSQAKLLLDRIALLRAELEAAKAKAEWVDKRHLKIERLLEDCISVSARVALQELRTLIEKGNAKGCVEYEGKT